MPALTENENRNILVNNNIRFAGIQCTSAAAGHLRLISDILLLKSPYHITDLQRDDDGVGMCLNVPAILSTSGANEPLQLCYLLIEAVDVLQVKEERKKKKKKNDHFKMTPKHLPGLKSAPYGMQLLTIWVDDRLHTQ